MNNLHFSANSFGNFLEAGSMAGLWRALESLRGGGEGRGGKRKNENSTRRHAGGQSKDQDLEPQLPGSSSLSRPETNSRLQF